MGKMSLQVAEHLPAGISLPLGGKPPLGARVVIDVLTYGMLVSVCLAVNWSMQAKEREKRALTAETYLAEARLSALRMQLQPHFLFNALNSISTLVHTNPAAADDMIANLSTLLRQSLQHMEEQEIPLRHELDFLRSYLDIEQARYGDRLVCEWDISPDTLTAFLPSLLLQPLVENAIRHGLSPLSRRVQVSVRSWIDGEMLHLQVSDDGAGYDAHTQHASEKSTHIGLNNTRARLAALYGNRQTMTVHAISSENGIADGCIVEICLPHHTDLIS
jgi:LytS/YehU family sensor histidine kinase